jgi:hypothetical protein
LANHSVDGHAAELVDHSTHPCVAPILFYQTAAGPCYEEMLEATEAPHRAYCRANGLDYFAYVGIRRGFHPWQASFNRIEQLHDLLTAGFRGWFAYLDADAVICQPQFDLRRYLGKRYRCALIAAPGGEEKWAINNGIFFLNLGHPLGREIAVRWHAAYQAVSLEMLQDAGEPWQPLPDGRAFPDDQHLLQMELMRDPALADATLIEAGGLINPGRGRFIRQFLRTTGSPAERLAAIRAMVASLA